MDEARRAGEALAQAAAELARIWRAARLEAPPEVFPGALDGVVESLVAAVGEALVMGRSPADAWGRAEGVVRVDPDPARTDATFRAEIRLVGEVLASACEALRASAEVTDFVAQAVEATRQALEALVDGGRPPAGVLVVTLASRFRPRDAGRR